MDDTAREPSDAAWQEVFSGFPPVSTQAWLDQMREDLGGADPLEALTWPTLDGLPVRPFYQREDVAGWDVSLPEDTRHPWRIRQDIAAADVQAANKLAREALVFGAEEIGFALRLESDARPGIPIHNQDDVRTLLQGINLSQTALHLAGRPATSLLPALLLNEAERAGVDPARLKGSLEMDPIGDLLRSGSADLDRAFGHVQRTIETFEQAHSAVQTICVDSRPFHDAGASPIQEIAFTLAAWSAYLARLSERGMSIDRICASATLIVPVGTSFFPELAKLRAIRHLANQVTEAYGDAASPLPLTAYTSRWDQTLPDPHVNLLRGATGALAAILGGCDALCVLPFDGAAGTPDQAGLRLARNTQLILRHEAHLDRVADPAGGAYYVEVLTDAMGREAWALFQRIESQGGLITCVQDGFIQEQIDTVRQPHSSIIT